MQDRAELKKRFEQMTDEMLEYHICDLEQIRMTLADLNGANHPSVNEVNMELDLVAGEMIRRDELKKNGPEPKPTTPKAPDTFFQLMCLGDGSLTC